MSLLEGAADARSQRDAFIRAEHFRYHRRPPERPGPDDFALPERAGLLVEAPHSPLIEQMAADFKTFCARCMQVRLESTGVEAAIRLRLNGDGDGLDDVLDPAREAFTLTVTDAGVDVEAVHERGLLHATHYLERLMADRGGPYLAHGQRQCRPVFTPRMTIGMNVPLSDEYLSLMSHFAANGMRAGARLPRLCRSRVLPELNHPDAERNLAALNERTARLLRHGIDTYLYVCAGALPAEHRVFLHEPACRGAPYRVFDDMACQHVLCSSHPDVLAFYDEAVADLFRAVPEAAGAIFIVGGEGFMHCYTRPLGPFEGHSSCPRCRDRDPATEVARLINRVAAAVKSTGRQKPVFAWPYSAFTWSGSDRAQIRWMERLSDDVLVLSNFATNTPDEQNGAGVYLYDYNIKCVGPSRVFRAQAEQTAKMGRRIYAKTESNATPSVYFVPYIPVHFRWHARFKEMAAAGVAGYMGQWGFYAMNGSLPEELQYHAVWNPDASTEELLRRAAVRDFGVSDADAEVVVDAWRTLSEAWEDFPYSAMTSGEREFYARGPLHYGPAHPLIFNVQSRYGLPAAFFGISGDLADLATPEEREALLKDAKPRYVSELLLTLPYGVAATWS